MSGRNMAVIAKQQAVPFVPTDVAGCVAWYDASNAASFTFSSGTVVSQWNDRSLSRHLVQSTVSKQPSRSGTRNSLATVIFDGVDDVLQCLGFGDGGDNRTVFALMQAVSYPSTYGRAMGLDVSSGVVDASPATQDTANATTGIMVSSFTVGGGLGAVPSGFRNGATKSTFSTAAGVWACFTSKWDGVDHTMYRDGTAGTAVGSTGTFSASASARLNVGGGGSFAFTEFGNVEVGEIVVYTSALGTTDRQSVESYLRTKWATP